MANVNIPYVNRSYQQIKEFILTRLFGVRDDNGQFVPGAGLVPEVTDHTENSLLVRIISVWAGLIEMLNYYIDNASTETFLATCRRYRSGVLIARFYDYRIKCRTAATVNITFYLSAAHTSTVTIPANTIVLTADGINFYTTQDLVIAIGDTRGTVGARQASNIGFTTLGTSNGKANQVFELATTTAFNSVSIRIGGVSYASKDTFAFSTPTDKHFVETVNESGVPIVKFGDGYFGIIPASGATIEVSYKTTFGVFGNVAPYLINTIVSSLTLPSGITATCSNLNAASGGGEIESLAELKRRVPLSNRTRMAAVPKQDYIDLTETYPSVQKAGVEYSCGADIKLYIVPTGGGIASTELLADVTTYMDDKKIMGRRLSVLPTGQVRIKLGIRLRIRPDYNQTAVYAAVKAKLTTFGSYLNQQIGGAIELNDVIAEIESTEGVIVSKVDTMTTIPFARPLGDWQTLDWTVATGVNSSETVQWKISFTAVDRFQLLRNGSYIGTYDVGDTVTRNEMVFTINDEYTIGDEWVFTTYPYFGSVILSEMSLPVILEGDIALSGY